MENGFWEAVDILVKRSRLIIDRPKGSVHPRYTQCVYPLDYGYLENTSSMDGQGIDVWSGSQGERQVTAVICTVDLLKGDSEIKILLDCTQQEQQEVFRFHNEGEYMKGLLIPRPEKSL